MFVNFRNIKDIPAYIISTDKNINRFESSKKLLLELGFTNINRWKGLDSETENPHTVLKSKNIRVTSFKNKGEMSCALAHIELLEDMLSKEEPYRLIFEDDIIVHTKFHEYINQLDNLRFTDFDVLFLGGWYWSYQNQMLSKHELRKIQKYKNYFQDVKSFETHSYLATNNFAKKILNKYYNPKNNTPAIDNFYSEASYTRRYLLNHSPLDSDNLDDIKLYNENNIGLFYQRMDIFSEIQNNVRETNTKHSGGTWVKIDDRCSYDFSSSNILRGSTINKKENIPESGILILKNGILSRNGLVLNEQKQTIVENSWFGKTAERSPNVYMQYINHRNKFNFLNVKKLNGKGLNLYSIFAATNTGHFILDCMSKIDILLKAKLNINDFDYVILPDVNSILATQFNIQTKFVEYLNIPSEKIIYIDSFNFRNYQFDELYDVSLNGKPRHYRKGCFDIYREIFKLKNVTPHRRIYVKRDNASTEKRILENIDMVENLLRQYNFEFISCEEHDAEIEHIFNEAAVVVGTHGAGLSHCCFSQKGTKLIEFLPVFHQYSYYMSLAHANDMEYTGLLCGHGSQEERFVVNCSLLNDILIGNL